MSLASYLNLSVATDSADEANNDMLFFCFLLLTQTSCDFSFLNQHIR